MKLLPVLQRAIRGEAVEGLPMTFPPPVAKLIGMEVTEVEEGRVVFRLQARREEDANPMGTLHGGIICDLADGAMGIACASTLELGESFTTVELRTTFFRPVKEGLLEARARVVNGGKTVVYAECDVVLLPEGKLVAKSSCTCMILRGEQALRL